MQYIIGLIMVAIGYWLFPKPVQAVILGVIFILWGLSLMGLMK